MSKSIGNVIDPLEIIDGCTLDELKQKLEKSNFSEKEVARAKAFKEKEFPQGIPPCGADSLRFSLLAYMNQPRSINIDVNRIIGYRLFWNKIQNGAKFILANVDQEQEKDWDIMQIPEVWILGRLNETIRICDSALASYDFFAYSQAIYNFWLKDFCDVYIEVAKSRINPSVQFTLLTVLESSMRLMHPAMPFIT